ncbi:hypothetical protein [Actinomadura sp. DC4]|uniref:hypothetical protein n=1 Tax=Actinomadura sp. DC4 TaxID=3055069 RepID=UPI0025B0D4C6|nr:hypothetical protein [Actinomadura sp. DC4]MDN3360048.1 hypothetical protein [Actinomadura sp. DC4]
MIECKAHSFSPDSSTANQGRKLLATCSAPSAAVGVSADSSANAFVIYAVPSEDASQQLATLDKLTQELVEMEIPSSKFGVLGLSIEDGGLWAELDIPSLEEGSDLKIICKRSWITDGGDQDARPIYLVPYDPTAADNQIPQEREYCGRQLTQRILTYAMSVVGRAEVPDSIRIMANDALKSATFDISDRWQAKELDKFRSRIAQEIGSALNRGELKGKVDVRNTFVEVTLASLDEQKIALALLDKSQDGYIANQLTGDQMQVVDEG